MPLRLLLSGLAAIAVLALGNGTALADPVNSPKSFTVVATCDSREVTVLLLANPSRLGWQLATTSVSITAALTIKDAATEEVIFQFETPGFDKNVVPTETCIDTTTVPGAIVTVKVFFTPPTP